MPNADDCRATVTFAMTVDDQVIGVITGIVLKPDRNIVISVQCADLEKNLQLLNRWRGRAQDLTDVAVGKLVVLRAATDLDVAGLVRQLEIHMGPSEDAE